MLLWTQLNKCLCGVSMHPLGTCPRDILLGLAVCCFLIFWETTLLISRVAEQVCIPTSNGGVLPILCILSNISYHWCFCISHFNWCIEPASSNCWKQMQGFTAESWVELPKSSQRMGGVKVQAKKLRPWWGWDSRWNSLPELMRAYQLWPDRERIS